MFRLILRYIFIGVIGLATSIGWVNTMPNAPSNFDLTFAGFGTENQGVAFAQSLTPLERLLNADGTLNLTTGFSGSLDVNGWAMRTDANGAPRFVRANATSADDARWDGRFDLPGPSNNVFALAVSGSTLYVAGSFTTIGFVNVNHIASWDIQSGAWTPLANGVDGNVTALAVSGSILYVGGIFTRVCGNTTCSSDNLTVNNIAQWNGAAWSALGSGVNSNVTALAVSGSNLYVGGLFTLASGVTVNHIARWNGSNWSALGNGVDNQVNALAMSGSNLFVGGVFTQACGNIACNSGNLTVNHIAQWDGSVWSTLGNGVNDTVNALAASGSNLFMGGGFTQACGNAGCNSSNLTVNRIAQWNGNIWSALGNGVNNSVNALAVSGSNLFAGGAFNEACGNTACNNGNVTVNRIAQWSGSASAWSTLGNGLNNDVLVLVMSGSNLYVGGFFSRTCDDVACNSSSLATNHLAQWNGSLWLALGNGLSSFVNALAVSGNNLYVGGSFSTAGGLSVNRIAQWNGSYWSALGHGVNGAVQALAVSGNNLYVGGTFSEVCGNLACNSGNFTVNNIARWNGVAWSSLGGGVDGQIKALAVSGSNLYVGGAILQVCGNAACDSGNFIVNNIALWSGTAWSALNNGVNGAVQALAVSGDDLYVGGIFNRACGNAACTSDNLTVNRIALWSSSGWFALDNGVSGSGVQGVQALAVSGSNLYVGGFFDAVCGSAACDSGNMTVNNIAQWNGIAWSALGNGVNSFGVQALAVNGNNLYVGGTFTQVCGNTACNSGNTTVNNIAQWNGMTWSALGSGADNAVWALALSGNDLYVAGNFSTAGGKPSYFLGRWAKPFAVYLPIVIR